MEQPEGKELREYPVLPVTETLLFPHMVIPLVISEPGLIKLVEEAIAGDRTIVVVGVREEEGKREFYEIGTAGLILRMARTAEESIRLIIQGISRVRIREVLSHEPYIRAKAEILEDIVERDLETEALMSNVRNQFVRILDLSPQMPSELKTLAANIDDPGVLADMVVSNVNITLAERQEILETLEVKKRLEKTLHILTRQVEILELGQKIQAQVRDQMEKSQREYYLREQLRVIQKELGEAEAAEIEELKKKIEEADLPDQVRKEAERELRRLSRMHPSSAEYTVVRNYLDWLLDLPWRKSTEDRLDLKEAQAILDADHYDLEKVKNRILEHLAVRKLKPDTKGPILCFVGPPGVGKTSLGRSIARAMGRKFLRISLGGVRDEAEIRGHRRTYVGAMPGRIIQGLRRVGVNNPVFMLDEIDKLGADFRGDPASALLEVLDPEQNATFSDHYLEIEFDLSQVMFIATANVLDTIPGPLLDRMEVIEIPGYTEEDKLHIAKRYLIPRQLEAHGLTTKNLRFTNGALTHIIRQYTREAGLRNLERQIAAICRAVAKEVALGEADSVTIRVNDLDRYLGPPKYLPEVAERTKIPGVAVGLAWTPFGGEILFVEATRMKGQRRLILTGKLGEVMRESAEAALSYIRSKASELGIPEDFFDHHDIHIHVPAGAIPKDGPSAGITILVALVSLLTDRTVRHDVAMTGEITLRGLILPVGGIKEKVLAALRAGIKEVILPKRNQKDLEEIPKEAREKIKFHLVSRVEEALAIIFPRRRRRKKSN
ncbi:endopeptidase La [Thermosulfuriphilus ammonigenes]|uniref:Lon protease n=2 Tax=Thermosulfuriphilus ammonigenes TaxID=1936021 RepID=A0A6G7PZB2_9BACT|nr:endopeptidase La [Thermosulfuriphilus ammonigenes]